MASTPLSTARLIALSSQTMKLILDRQAGRPVDENRLRINFATLQGNSGAMDARLRRQYDSMRALVGPTFLPVEEPQFSEDDDIHEPYHDDPAHDSANPFQTAYTNPFAPIRTDEYEQDPRAHLDEHGLYQEQQHMMDEQDTHLDTLAVSIFRQHRLAGDINGELEEQVGVLEAFEHELDSTSTRLGRARHRMDRFVKGAGGNGSTILIGVLILVLLILIVVFKT